MRGGGDRDDDDDGDSTGGGGTGSVVLAQGAGDVIGSNGTPTSC